VEEAIHSFQGPASRWSASTILRMVSFRDPVVLPRVQSGLGRIRTGDLRCVRATSSPLDYEPAASGADASAGIMVAMADRAANRP
jgi:hypothetical protein